MAFVEGLDPSEKTQRSAGRPRFSPSEYWQQYEQEKAMPAWLRYGAAVYAERYFFDKAVEAAGDGGDPFWARTWSKQNLEGRGGLRPVAEILKGAPDPAKVEDSQRWLIEAGLLVSFLVDGGNEAAGEALTAMQNALREGHLKPSHLRNLEAVLTEHEAEVQAYAKP
ncbi:MAG: hypothetical protein R3F33_01550 [Planctomycetota bacterium]